MFFMGPAHLRLKSPMMQNEFDIPDLEFALFPPSAINTVVACACKKRRYKKIDKSPTKHSYLAILRLQNLTVINQRFEKSYVTSPYFVPLAAMSTLLIHRRRLIASLKDRK